MPDILDPVLDSVLEHAKHHNIPVIHGTIDADVMLPTVTYQGAGEDSEEPLGRVESFLTETDALRPTVIIVSVTRVDEDDWENAQRAWAVAETEIGDQYPQIITHARDNMVSAGDPVGTIAELTVVVIAQNPPLLITLTEQTGWCITVLRHDSIIDELRTRVDDQRTEEERREHEEEWEERQAQRRRQEEAYRAQEAEQRKWSGATRREIVAQLANHPDFPNAKREEARILIFERLVGTEMPEDRNIARMISREALAMYDLEIKGKR